MAQALSTFASDWSTEFHLWAMEWTATDVKLSLDDKLVYDFKVSSVTSGTNPYTGNPFYILVNLAIGANGGDPSGTTFPIRYQVDPRACAGQAREQERPSRMSSVRCLRRITIAAGECGLPSSR